MTTELDKVEQDLQEKLEHALNTPQQMKIFRIYQKEAIVG